MDNTLGIKMTRDLCWRFTGFEGLMGLSFTRLRLPSKLGKLGGQLVGLFIVQTVLVAQSLPAESLGVVCPHAIKPPHAHLVPTKSKHSPSLNYTEVHLRQGSASGSPRSRSRRAYASASGRKNKKAKATRTAIYYPQDYADSLKSTTVVPGVIYKHFKGPLTMNLLDIDTARAAVKIRPILAGEAFDSLQNISQHAKSSHALAAINANYFKKNGTPLGTLILDGEWVAGPLYDRVSLGIAKSGKVRVDRVNLAGVLETNNPACPRIWINNINQPRRTGSRLVAYTRRWGTFVRLPYEGNLLAVSAQGEVVGKSGLSISIPAGGYVLSDSKDGPTANLGLKDKVKLTWRTSPSSWSDVDEAVSGGPLLIKDGQVFVDLKDEAFRAGWTSCQIKARTAAGVTRDHHLLLLTVEGPHTLWDLAKFLHNLGAVDALNLDGGGSTAMFVNGETVTQSKRKVASAIGVFSDNAEAGRHSAEARNIVESTTPPTLMPAPAPAPNLLPAATENQSKSSQATALPKSELHPPILSTAPLPPTKEGEADQLNPAPGQQPVDNQTITANNRGLAPLPGK
jgi:uncharacterized protein YigE (DUF2233 family)